jgi:alkanesulfonate monooxygenase SsuD/methylene tetrahydromethanopterin reductase-like flavin-dependent oxidoreductase (luciferase family)
MTDRVGVGFSRGLEPLEIMECAVLAEELGYESAWVAEGHAGDQFAILTAIAMRTSRILLGTSISSVFARTVPTIAMAAATVDLYSAGRFILGLGSSHKVQVEPEHGLVFDHPVQRVRECVDIVRGLLRDGRISYPGEVTNIQQFDFWFETQRKEMPIYIAAVRPKMLQICGEISEGTILTWCTPEHAKMAAENVALGAEQAGKNPADVDVTSLVNCFVSDDKDEARDKMRGPMATYAGFWPRYRKLMADAGYPDEIEQVKLAWQAGDHDRARQLVPSGLIDEISLVGTPAECRARIAEYHAAGLRLPIVTPRVEGPTAKEDAMRVIRACAPGT